KARIHDYELGLVVGLGFGYPLETTGVRLGGVSAHDEHNIGVFDVDPMVRHRSTAKRRGKTCHRRTMSDTSLVVESKCAKAADNLMRDVSHFVGAGRCGQHAGG